MDQNVIRLTKLHYKNHLLSSIFANKNQSVTTLLKQTTLKDAVINLSVAWDKITQVTIQKCWTNMLDANENVDSEDDIPLSVIRAKLRSEHDDISHVITEAIDLLNEISPQVEYSENDINMWNTDNATENILYLEDTEDSTSSEEETASERNNKINHSQAIHIFNSAIQWANENDSLFSDIACLQIFRQKAVMLQLSANKQTNVTNYFEKLVIFRNFVSIKKCLKKITLYVFYSLKTV